MCVSTSSATASHTPPPAPPPALEHLELEHELALCQQLHEEEEEEAEEEEEEWRFGRGQLPGARGHVGGVGVIFSFSPLGGVRDSASASSSASRDIDCTAVADMCSPIFFSVTKLAWCARQSAAAVWIMLLPLATRRLPSRLNAHAAVMRCSRSWRTS
jgi:hypothetical protein